MAGREYSYLDGSRKPASGVASQICDSSQGLSRDRSQKSVQEHPSWLKSSHARTALCVGRVERLYQTLPSRCGRPVPSVHIKTSTQVTTRDLHVTHTKTHLSTL